MREADERSWAEVATGTEKLSPILIASV